MRANQNPHNNTSARSRPSTPRRRASSPTSTGPRPRPLGSRTADVFDTLQVYLGSVFVNDLQSFRAYDFRFWPRPMRRSATTKAACSNCSPVGLGRDGAAGLGGQSRAHDRPLSGAALQPLSGRRDPGRQPPGARRARRSATMERLAAERLPPGYGYEWTELAYQEKLAANTGIMVFGHGGGGGLPVAGRLYESVTLPFAVVLISCPCACFAADPRRQLRGADNNIPDPDRSVVC